MVHSSEETIIDFTPQDHLNAPAQADAMTLHSQLMGYKDADGLSPEDAYRVNLEGAYGEIAAARALGLPTHQMRVGAVGEPDIIDQYGTKWHVRATVHHCLAVKPRNPMGADDHYLLVILAPDYSSARVVGWIRGSQVRGYGRLTNFGRPNRPLAWAVQQSSLLPIADYHERQGRMATKKAREVASC